MFHNFFKNCLHKIENDVKLKNATNFKLPQILKCHIFKSAANVPFYSYFVLHFSFELSYFYPIFFEIFEVLVFFYFFTELCWIAWVQYHSRMVRMSGKIVSANKNSNAKTCQTAIS